MAKTFQLDVLTPERLFYSGPAEAITIQGLNGELTVLADHIHMVAPLRRRSERLSTGNCAEADRFIMFIIE